MARRNKSLPIFSSQGWTQADSTQVGSHLPREQTQVYQCLIYCDWKQRAGGRGATHANTITEGCQQAFRGLGEGEEPKPQQAQLLSFQEHKLSRDIKRHREQHLLPNTQRFHMKKKRKILQGKSLLFFSNQNIGFKTFSPVSESKSLKINSMDSE